MKISKMNDWGSYAFTDKKGRAIRFDPDLQGIKNKDGEALSYTIWLELGERGGDKEGLRFTRDAISWMFNETPCLEIVGYIDEYNRASSAFANAAQWDVLGTEMRGDTKIIKRGISIGKWIHRRGKKGHDKALLKKGGK